MEERSIFKRGKVLLEEQMMKRILYLVCCILIITSIATSNANAQQVNLSSPEATVNSFVASINQYNFKQATLCVEDAKPEAATELADFEQGLKEVHATITTSDLHLTVKDAEATISVTATVKVGDPQETNSVDKSFLKLHVQKNEWRIVPEDPSRFTAVPPQNILGYTAAFLAHPEAFEKAIEQEKENICLLNLKQLAEAMPSFWHSHHASIHNNASIRKGLSPYVENDSIFFCPDDERFPDIGAIIKTTQDVSSYSLNPYFEGGEPSSKKSSADVVLLYEGKNGVLDFRHNGKACVAFVDGHVETVSQEAAKYLRWKP